MTVAAPFIMAASAAMSAYSAYNQAKQQKAAYEYSAAVNRNNAMIAEWNAQDAARRGETDLINQRQRTAALMGTQRATFAGRGIDMSEGSALNILTDTASLGEQDALTVKDNTAKNVWAAKVQAQNERSSADFNESSASAQNPWLSAGTSLLTSASRVDPKWYSQAFGNKGSA